MHKSPTNTVERTLEAIKKDRPAYAELVELFGPLFRAQAELAAQLKDEITAPAVDKGTLTQGAHILATLDLKDWSKELLHCAKTMRPILSKLIPAEIWEQLPETFFTDEISLLKLAKARLNGESEAFMNTSEKENSLPPVLAYVIEATMTPLLVAMKARLGELVPIEGWEQGTCPMCGSLPTMIWLSPKEQHDLEYLVGGGGRKYLHCSLCDHDWRFRRDACPSCGNDDQHNREVLFAKDNRRERIEACNKCGTYLVSLDLREYDQPPHLSVAPMGLMHLDIIAREKKYAPLFPTVWNGLEV